MKKHHEVLLQLFKVLESFKPQKPDLLVHLAEVIEVGYYPVNTVLYEPDEIVKKIFFLASGIAVAYAYTERGEKQLLHIYKKNDFIAGQSFTQQIRNTYYLMACKDAYMLHMTHTQLKETYRAFPAAEELARFRLSAMENKEVQHKQMLILPGIERVAAFYLEYPELLEPRKYLRDADIGTYLIMTGRSLRSLRNRLLREGRLKRTDKNRG